MRKTYLAFLYIVTILLIFHEKGIPQDFSKKNSERKWTTNDPFKTAVFIENYGQFDNWVTTPEQIKYVINSGEKIYFTRNGVIFQVDKIEKSNENEKGREYRKKRKESVPKEEKESSIKIEKYYISMNWEGCNPEPVIEVSEQSEGYYTYGETGYGNLKAKGYKKIVYKNLYPGIDVEYSIPVKKGGIKYTLLVHPGADAGLIKMHYSGNINEIKKDIEGNIIIETPAGAITDHAPLSFYENNKTAAGAVADAGADAGAGAGAEAEAEAEAGAGAEAVAVAVAFELKGNTVSFKLPTPNSRLLTQNSKLQTLIIDPWTTTPNSMTNNNIAHDIAFDDNGNVYVSGGTYPYKISKYDAGGTIIWTYSYPSGFSHVADNVGGTIYHYYYYSKFSVLPHSGTVFIGEGVSKNGPRVIKLYPNGTYNTITPYLLGNEEIWFMFYNRCTGTLAGFGGGTVTPNNMQLIADTNLVGSTFKNFNGSTDPRNDIACVEMDFNGDFYTLMSSINNPYANHIMKSLASNNYNPPVAFDVVSGYDYYEATNWDLSGFIGNVSVRANALALNSIYLYSFDGRMLKVWDKNNGNKLDSILVSPTDLGGCQRSNEGIAVDECNNIYVGDSNVVHIYSYNGSDFIPGSSITTDIPAQVHDIRLDRINNMLYICGPDYITTTPALECLSSFLSLTTSIDTCLSSASVVVNGGTPPYKYYWSNGDTTNSISGVPFGIYTITVTDNSCILQKAIDTIYLHYSIPVIFSGDTSICMGSSTVITASGATSYKWAPATGLSPTTGAIVTMRPTSTTTYTVTATTANGCVGVDSIKIYVKSLPHPDLGRDTVLCDIPFCTLDAKNSGSTYLWSTTETTRTITVSSGGNYSVTVTKNSCKGFDTVKVSFASAPIVFIGNDTTLCPGNTVTLKAGNTGASYQWSTGAASQSITVSNQGVYWVGVSVGGCITYDTIIISYIPPIVLGRDLSFCNRSEINLNAGIYASSYLWSTGDTTRTITISEPGKYWVSATINNCELSDTITVTGGFTSLYFPNTFTPNNDGLNDVFFGYGVGITLSDMKIFNRWGGFVFETTDILTRGWDGRTPAGPAEMGVYVWVLKYRTICNGDKDLIRHGRIMLLR